MNRSKRSTQKPTSYKKQQSTANVSSSRPLSSVSSALSSITMPTSRFQSPTAIQSRAISTSPMTRSSTTVPQVAPKTSLLSSMLSSSPFTLPVRFSTTSKKWNKKSKVAQKDAHHRKLVQKRYHGATRYMALPKMDTQLFARLPRPYYIESESLNIIIPAPQYERLATPEEFKTAKKAVIAPY